MEADLSDSQQKLEDAKQRNHDMCDEHDERMRELRNSVCEQTHVIDNLRAQLDKTSEENDGTIKLLNADMSHLHTDLDISQSLVDQLASEKNSLSNKSRKRMWHGLSQNIR